MKISDSVGNAFLIAFMSWAIVGCQAKKESLAMELKNVKRIDVGYTIDGKKRTIAFEDEKAIADILGAIEIKDEHKAQYIAIADVNSVDCTLADDAHIKLVFSKPRRMDRRRWGSIDLNSEKFFEKVTAIVSEQEGRPIDILSADNRPKKE